MKHLLTLALFAVSTAALAADEFDFYFADISILQDKKVQAELKITETQRTNMNKHAAWLNTQSQAIDTQVKGGKLTPENANKQMGVHLGTLKKKICDELSAAQLKRLREITLQRDGLLPLMDLKMGERIGLTKAQTQKLRDSYIANDKKAKDIQTAAYKPIFDKYAAMKPKDKAEEQKLIDQRNKELEAAQKKIQPQLEALGKSYGTTVDTTLSKEQKDAFAALKGKPFEPK
jgi:hypothetical protein